MCQIQKIIDFPFNPRISVEMESLDMALQAG